MDNLAGSEQSVEIENSQSRIIGILDDEISAAVEALIFASPEPLTAVQLARIVGCDKRRIPQAIESLNMRYIETARSFRIERFGDNYRFYTIPMYDKYIGRLADLPRPAKLSRAALEVLSIIAYRQPVVKSEIERIRGIDSDGVIRTLMEKGLIVVSGRSDAPGRPLLYKTTGEFLEFFGISDLSELPSPEIPEAKAESAGALTLLRQPEISEHDSSDAIE